MVISALKEKVSICKIQHKVVLILFHSQTTGSNDLVAHFHFEGNTTDSTVNLNRSVSFEGVSFVEGRISYCNN